MTVSVCEWGSCFGVVVGDPNPWGTTTMQSLNGFIEKKLDDMLKYFDQLILVDDLQDAMQVRFTILFLETVMRSASSQYAALFAFIFFPARSLLGDQCSDELHHDLLQPNLSHPFAGGEEPAANRKQRPCCSGWNLGSESLYV